MKKNIIVAAIAAASALLLTVSCQKEAQLETNSEGKTFTAVIDQNVTKTTVTESTIADQYKVNWVSGDEININGAVYSATPDGTDATKASFTYVSGTTPTAPYTAIYPASLYNAGTFELPATQTYEAGKFNAPMYAESSTESLEFKNICGVICFSLKGTAKVKRIAFSSNDAVCGTFSMMDDATTMDLDLTGTGTTVTLDCGTGVQLNETTATNFYVYLPPRTYPIGTKIVITDTAGKVFTKITTERATIARSNIYTFDWTPTFVNEGPLSGKFSVSATEQVQFSKGNLQATYDGSKYTWGFAANQYDYIGNAAGNTTIDSQTSGAVVDLFGWPTSATNFGISTSIDDADYSGDFVDWGKNIGDGSTWRTLTQDEWFYLFETRSNASSLYKSFVTVCGKNCLVIAPDGYTETIASSYDASTWPKAEAAGLVCLPAAGDRHGSTFNIALGHGLYWASSNYYPYLADLVEFADGGFGRSHYYRYYGFSVRLITESK